MTSASCLCGDIQFKITGELTDASYCHCSLCRKSTGSAFAAYASTPINDIEWLSGENKLHRFAASHAVTKLFCPRCASTVITHHSQEPEVYHISLGNLVRTVNISPQYHQFVDSKVDWYSITDKLKQYPAWPDEE